MEGLNLVGGIKESEIRKIGIHPSVLVYLGFHNKIS